MMRPRHTGVIFVNFKLNVSTYITAYMTQKQSGVMSKPQTEIWGDMRNKGSRQSPPEALFAQPQTAPRYALEHWSAECRKNLEFWGSSSIR